MVWHQAVECPICHQAVCQTGPLNKLYRHINRKISGRPWCDASLLPYEDAKKLADGRSMHICHQCGRLFTLNSAGKFPRHCRGAMMERARGGRYIHVIPRSYCGGTKKTPEQTKVFYWGTEPGCTCEDQQVTWRNPIERQFALWGTHAAKNHPEPEPEKSPCITDFEIHDDPFSITVDGEEVKVANVESAAVDVTLTWAEDEDLIAFRQAVEALDREIDRLITARNTIRSLITGLGEA